MKYKFGLSEKEKITIRTFLVWAVVTGIYVVFVKYILPIVWPFVIAFILALIIHPIANFLKQAFGLGKTIATAIILMLIFCLIAGIFLVLFLVVFELIRKVFLNRDIYGDILYEYVNGACARLEEVFHLEASNGEMARNVIDNVAHAFKNITNRMADKYMGEGIQVAGVLADGLLAFAIMYVSTVLFAKYYDDIVKKVRENELLNELSHVFANAKMVVGAYIKAQAVIMLITGVVCIVTLFIIGAKNPVVIGIVVGLMDALPMLGVGIVLIPWGIIELLKGSYLSAVALVTAFIICTVIREAVEPKLIGNKVGVHPIVILISLYVGYKLFGLLGFLLGPVGFIIIDCLTQVILDKTANLK